jgi:hypothetical protein
VEREWWSRKPRWYLPAEGIGNQMGHNDAVPVHPKPDPEISPTGLGWPIDVSRETLSKDSGPDTGLGWPQ